MLVTNLLLRSIRGFSVEQKFEIAPRLTVIYGANGSGKSSFAEAWDYVYSGETIAELLEPKNETKTAFANVHATIPPFCRIEFFHAGQTLYIEREGVPPRSKQKHNFPQNPPPMSPVVLQYRLQKAVYSSDSDRARFFSTILGLSNALDLVKKLESLGRSCEKDGDAARAQWTTIAELSQKLELSYPHPQVPSTAALEQNEAKLLNHLSALLGCDADRATVISEIKKAAGVTKTTEVSLMNLVPAVLLDDAATTTLQEGASAVAALVSIDKNTAERALWLRTGLNIAVPPVCPFCGASSLTDVKLREIDGLVLSAEEAASTLGRAESAIQRARRLVEAGNESELKVVETQLAKLAQAATELGGDKRPIVDEPVSKATAAVASWRLAQEEAKGDPAKLFMSALEFVQAMSEFQSTIPAMDKALQERLRPVHVAQFKLAALTYLESPARDKWMGSLRDLRIISEVAQLARVEFNEMLKENAASVRGEILRWYAVLRPTDTTPLRDLEIETGASMKVRVYAETHGVRGHASALASQSNANALGMACYVARIIKSGYKTIILDDPTQSLDPANKLTFERDFVRTLIEEGLQVIILTHDVDTARHLLDEHHALNPIGYSFDKHEKSGPKLSPLFGDSDHLIRLALDGIESKEESHMERTALHVRKLGELACTEYLKHHGEKVPLRPTFGNLVGQLDSLTGGRAPNANAMLKLTELSARLSNPLHKNGTDAPLTLPELAADLKAIIELRKSPGHLKYSGSVDWPVHRKIYERLLAIS